jgi:hypothetical protein
MNSDDLAFLPLKVTRTGPGGKRTFGKRQFLHTELRIDRNEGEQACIAVIV